MRKADYAALADMILEQRKRAAREQRTQKDTDRKEYWVGVENGARELAQTFAQRASVNRAEFLKACGIEP